MILSTPCRFSPDNSGCLSNDGFFNVDEYYVNAASNEYR